MTAFSRRQPEPSWHGQGAATAADMLATLLRFPDYVVIPSAIPVCLGWPIIMGDRQL
jgi:hypothetical protein